MLNITENHMDAISKHMASIDTNFITVGSVIKIKNNARSSNLKYVVVSVAGDTLSIVYKAQMFDKNGSVGIKYVSKTHRQLAVNLNESVEIPASWVAITNAKAGA